MPPKRKASQKRTKWTDKMVADLVTCRALALAKHADTSNTVENVNGRRKGYMEVMKDLWEEKGYASYGFSAQNLRDKVAQVLKSKERRLPDTNCLNETNDISINYSENDVFDSAQSQNNQNKNNNIEAEPDNDTGVGIVNEVNNINGRTVSEGIFASNNFQWGELNKEACVHALDDAYEEIVSWRRNIFILPTDKVEKAFIKELARLYQAYAGKSPLECIALKACSVMQSVLLQKPHAKSKTKDHIACLERRLSLWNEGKFKELLSEGKCIQRHLSNSTASNLTTQNEMQKIARGFNRLMLQGKVRQAVNLISNANRRGLLNTDTLIPVGEDKDGNIQ